MATLITGTSGVDVDVEAALTTLMRPLLVSRFPGVVVASGVPKAGNGDLVFPALLVVVSRAGGAPLLPAHDRPIVTFQCWAAAGTVEAWELCGAVRALAVSLSNEQVVLQPVRAGEPVETVWVSYLHEIGGPQPFSDPRTPHERYQFTSTFQVRR